MDTLIILRLRLNIRTLKKEKKGEDGILNLVTVFKDILSELMDFELSVERCLGHVIIYGINHSAEREV